MVPIEHYFIESDVNIGSIHLLTVGSCSHILPYDQSKVKYIMQGEYSIVVPNNTIKPILTSFGAGPCVILCMRDITNGRTMLAHIDALTIHPVSTFSGMFNDGEGVDVYIIGGDSSSRDSVHRLLLQLYLYSFIRIKFAHIIDNKSNSFARTAIRTWVLLLMLFLYIM